MASPAPPLMPSPVAAAARAASGVELDSMYSRLTLNVFIIEGCNNLPYSWATKCAAESDARAARGRSSNASALPLSGVAVAVALGAVVRLVTTAVAKLWLVVAICVRVVDDVDAVVVLHVADAAVAVDSKRFEPIV